MERTARDGARLRRRILIVLPLLCALIAFVPLLYSSFGGEKAATFLSLLSKKLGFERVIYFHLVYVCFWIALEFGIVFVIRQLKRSS